MFDKIERTVEKDMDKSSFTKHRAKAHFGWDGLEYFYENKLINFGPELYVFTMQSTKPSYDLDSGH